MLPHAVLCCAVLCWNELHHAVLCHAVLRHAVAAGRAAASGSVYHLPLLRAGGWQGASATQPQGGGGLQGRGV